MDLQSLALSMSRSENLPVMPQIITQILAVIDDPMAPPRALEAVLERDASIVGKVLRVANSAAYSSREVSSVGRAVTMLGLNTVRSLVVSIGYQKMLAGRSQSQYMCRVSLWSHSLAVGLSARILGKMRLPACADELYAAGLMHDMGLLVIDRFCPAELDQCILGARDEKRPLSEVMDRVLGYNQTHVGEMLGERWRLSPRLIASITHHLAPDGDDQFQDTTALMSAAETLANQAGYALFDIEDEMGLHPVAEAAIDMPAEQLGVIRTVIANEVEKNLAAFQLVKAA